MVNETILIIDDNADARLLLSLWLKGTATRRSTRPIPLRQSRRPVTHDRMRSCWISDFREAAVSWSWIA